MEPVEAESGGEGVTGPEPMCETVSLDGQGACIAEARRHAADFLARVQGEYGLPVSARVMDVTRLVVSELVTNARKYASGPVLLELRVVDGLVEVVVWDDDPRLPVAQTADPGRVGQHGLEIVMAVVQGFEVHREPVGKRVIARVALADGAEPDPHRSRLPKACARARPD